MQNFQLHKEDYRYRTAAEGDCIEVTVYYTLGGANYFSGDRDQRGIMVSAKPITIKDGCVTFVIGAGLRAFLAPLARKNPKHLAAVAEKLDPIAPEIARIFAQDARAALAFALQRMAA